MGERVPQSVQSLFLRDYCSKNNLKFNLHAVEYTMDKCFLVFESCLKELENFDGIVMYSLFQLPENDDKRRKYFARRVKRRSNLKKLKYFLFRYTNLKNYFLFIKKKTN